MTPAGCYGKCCFTANLAKPSGTLTASAGSPFAVGESPGFTVEGDFNGDGIPDLAIANGESGDVSVLLGNGSGGFSAAAGSPFAMGSDPISMAVGDFNGDGIQDLAVASGQDKVTVLLGNGSGGFASAAGSPYAIGVSPRSVVVGDFNGDGIQDLAVSNADDLTITLLLGNGSGGFQTIKRAFGATFPFTMVVADFNNDGIQDLAVVNDEINTVTVLLGSGSGAFTQIYGSPFTVGDVDFLPQTLVVGDFNGDGFPDLAEANYGGDITVLLGDPRRLVAFNAVASVPLPAGTHPTSLVVGDFNGDGIPDLAALDYYQNSLTVLLGNGTGGFNASAGSTFATGSYPASLVAADFNGDGVLDLATANAGDNNVTVFLGGMARTDATLSTASSLEIAEGQSVPLTVTVSDSTPAFSVPAGTVTFFDGATVLGAVSRAAGPYTFTASGLALGTHTFNATYSGGGGSSGSASNTVTVQVLAAQTIAFGALSNVAVGTAPFSVSATASSGLAVSFSTGNPAVCTVSGGMVTIVAGGGCPITATQAGNDTFAAAMPVTQSFTVLFGDVAPTDYYYAAINALAQHGITAGCGNNGYCPQQNVTRDQMAIFVVRAIFGGDNFSYTTTPYFTDVQPATFGFKWIQKLRDLGITGGCTATAYCPTAVVTRDQMAIFIIRARLGVSLAGSGSSFAYPATPLFADVPTSEFAFPWIQRLKQDNITGGCTAADYCPSAAVIRGDMALFIMRGAFNQFLPAGTPVITQISPSTLGVGASGTYTITGANTNFVQGTTQLAPIPGVTIGAITVVSPTSMTVSLAASESAVAQPCSIVAITGTEQDVLPNGLVLQ